MKPFWLMLLNTASSLGKSNYLSILNYHRVLWETDPLRPETINFFQFKQQMSWLKKYFRVLPLQEALRLMEVNQLPSRACAITFDDGYIDNLTIAAPLLKEMGLPASFYVSSRMLGTEGMWIDHIIESTRETSRNAITVDKQNFTLNNMTQKQRFLRFFENHYKSLPLEQANKLVNEILNELGIRSFKPLFMNANEIRQLSALGMEIGSHGRHHRILSALENEEARREIVESKKEIEAVIEMPIKGFAYPNGKGPVDFSLQHMQMVKQAGYGYALSTNYGCSQSGDEKYRLKRFTPWRLSRNGFLVSMFLNYWLYQEYPFK